MRRRTFIAALCGAAAWPLVARGQQPAMPVIGYMSARSPEDTVEVLKAFHNGLGQGGFIDSRNVNIEYRWARGDYSRLPVLATELIGRHINVLVNRGRCLGACREGGNRNNPSCLQYGRRSGQGWPGQELQPARR
jgi:hypothetical protein